jgi:hypothetical protein
MLQSRFAAVLVLMSTVVGFAILGLHLHAQEPFTSFEAFTAVFAVVALLHFITFADIALGLMRALVELRVSEARNRRRRL